MELYKTEQILWEKIYPKSIVLEIKLKPWPQKITEVIPRVLALRHKWQGSSIIVVADLGIEVYFSDKKATLNFLEHEKQVTHVFLPEKVVEGMQVYVSCHLQIQDMNLSGDVLMVNLIMDFKLDAAIDRPIQYFPVKDVETKTITAIRSLGSKTWMGSSYGIFQKPDLHHILYIKPHLEQLDVKLLHGLLVAEGSIVLEIFYSDAEGIEKYDQMYIPIQENAEYETAMPERQAKARVDITGVKHNIRNSGQCDILVAYKLEVKILEETVSDVIVEFNGQGYEISKKNLVLNQIVSEDVFTFMLEEEFDLTCRVNNIVDVYGRLENLTCDAIKSGFTARGDLSIELYFISEDQHEKCKFLETKFEKTKLIENITGQEKYDLRGRVLHISAQAQGNSIKIKALLEIDFTGIIRSQLQAISDISPREGIQRELFHIERSIDEKNINFMEKFEITTDFAIDHLENVKGEITNIEVTVLDSRFLIQCSLNIHLFYAGRDGVIYSQKAVFPFGIFEDIKEGRPDMRVRVKPRISGIKTELVAMKTVSIIFMLNFELLATVEEDIYLVTAVSKDHIKTRQVFYEDYKFNVNHFLPLSSPLLMMKDVKAQTQKIWLDRNNSGSWAVGVLSISSSYVGKDHLIHQDFDQLDFRIKIPDMENVGPNQIIVCAKPSKIVSNTDSEMVEVEFEINIRVFSFVEIQ